MSINRSHQHIVENLIIIWLDLHINEYERDVQFLRNQLREVVKSIQTFVNIDECIDYLKNFKNEKVFLIVSVDFGEQLVPAIQEIPWLHSICVFSSNKTTDERWIKDYQKVTGIFPDIESLCNRLKRDLHQSDANIAPIGIISPSAVFDPHQLDLSFMYSQLLKEIFLKIEFSDMAKNIFASFCRLHQADNNFDPNVIDEFERDYDPQLAIWWYTRDCFLYSMLNKALRTQDIKILLKISFFIRDLHTHIQLLYLNSVNRIPLIVYRGQGMFNDVFDKIRKSEGGLLSFNNFLSTSTNRQVAEMFAESARDNSKLTGVLFQMVIDSSISTIPFTKLNNVSYFPNSEEEILFSMHSVFRIGKIKKIVDRLWEVELILTNDSDKELKRLTDYMREDLGFGIVPELHQLGSLMMAMGEFNRAEEIYKEILKSLPNNNLMMIAILHNNIGTTMSLKNEHSNAIPHFKKALEIQETSFPLDLAALAKLYNNIGDLYRVMGEYSTALSYCEKALHIREKSLSSDHIDLVNSHNNIGMIHLAMGQYTIALSHFEKRLRIQQESLLHNHPSLGISHNSIGEVYRLMGKYSDALSHFEKALRIQQKSLPPDHLDITTSHNNIGLLYRSLGDYPTALSHHEKVLKVRQEHLSPDSLNLANSHNNIGEVYLSMENYPDARLHFEKALEIREKVLLPDHPNLAVSHNNIGLLHQSLENYSRALSHHKKALEIRQRSLSSNHPDIAMSHNNIGLVYRLLGNYSTACSHHKKALEIREQSLSSDHPDIAASHNNISLVYSQMGQFSKALLHLEKARTIWQTSLPPHHPDKVALYTNLAYTCCRSGHYDDAVQYIKEAINIGSHVFNPGHPRVRMLQRQLDNLLHENNTHNADDCMII